MKKIIILILIILTIVSISGCKADKNSKSTTAQTTQSTNDDGPIETPNEEEQNEEEDQGDNTSTEIVVNGNITFTTELNIGDVTGLVIENEDGTHQQYGEITSNVMNANTYYSSTNYSYVPQTDTNYTLSNYYYPNITDGFVIFPIGKGLYLSTVDGNGLYNNLKGIVNEKGEWLLRPSDYFYIDYFSNNVARVSDSINVTYHGVELGFDPSVESNLGYIVYNNDNGNESITKMYPENNERFYIAGKFQGDYAVVAIKDTNDKIQYGVINKTGEYVVQPIYDYIHQEIVNNKIIVSKNAEFTDIYNAHNQSNNSTSAYYSENIGVIDLVTLEEVIPLEYDVVTHLQKDKYFIYDFETNVSQIIDLIDNSTKDMEYKYFNMVMYDDEYMLGLYGDYIYLVEISTNNVVARYDRYVNLLNYFGIKKFNSNFSDKGQKKLIYNFDTYTSSTHRDIDFVRSNLYYYVTLNKDIVPTSEPTRDSIIIDAKGNKITDIPEFYYHFASNDYNLHLVDPFICYPDGLVFLKKSGSSGKYAMNYNGEIVVDNLAYTSTFYNGKALVTKWEVINEVGTEIMYTLYRDGTLKQIDIGYDYISQNVMYQGELVNNDIGLIEYSPGIYLLKVFHNSLSDNTSTQTDYIMNVNGDILYDEDVNSIHNYNYDYLGRIREENEKYFVDGLKIYDVFTIEHGSSRQKALMKLFREQTLGEPGGNNEINNVIIDEKILLYKDQSTNISPFVFDFTDGSSIQVYLNDVLVDTNNYTYTPSVQHLKFSYDYLSSLTDSYYTFKVVSNNEEANIKVFLKGNPLFHYQYTEIIGIGASIKDISTTFNDFNYIEIYNVSLQSEITVAKLNGVDIINYLSFIVETNENNETFIKANFDPQLKNSLMPGEYTLEIGNESRTSKTKLKIVSDNQFVINFDTDTDNDFYYSGNYADLITEPAIPEKVGYTFYGWYDNPDYLGSRVQFPYTVKGNNTLYAKWVDNSFTYYTVIFRDMNGNIISTQAVKEGESAISPTITNNPGYNFIGWSQDFDNVRSNLIVDAIYDQYELIDLHVTFDTNGGSPIDGVLLKHGEKIPPFNLSTKTGYIFSGYYIIEDGIPFDISIDTYIVNKAVTIYLKWTPIVYTITYDLVGGTFTTNVVQYYTIESETIILPVDVEKPDYEFLGWFDGENNVHEITTGSYGDKTFVAKWNEIGPLG